MSRTGAACLDGSPPAYYLGDTSAPNWYFFLEGGGACDSESDCKGRAFDCQQCLDAGNDCAYCISKEGGGMCKAGGEGGTSVCWPASGGGGQGVPRGYNYVEIKYCSGDCHSGTQGLYTPWNVSFSGHLIVEEIIRSLKAEHTFNGNVILSGTSAGGRGAYLHADWLQEQLPDAKVYAAPQAGLFFPNATDFDTWKAAGADPKAELGLLANPGYWADVSTGHLEEGPYKAFKPKSCEAAHPAGTLLNPLCSVVGFYAPYVDVPLFPIEGQFDGTKPGNHGMPSLPKTGAIPEEQSRYIEYYGRRVARTVEAIVAKPGNGAYVPSCNDHEYIENSKIAFVGGVTPTEALAAWVGGSGASVHLDNCTSSDCLPCNARNGGHPLCSCDGDTPTASTPTLCRRRPRAAAARSWRRRGRGWRRERVRVRCPYSFSGL